MKRDAGETLSLEKERVSPDPFLKKPIGPAHAPGRVYFWWSFDLLHGCRGGSRTKGDAAEIHSKVNSRSGRRPARSAHDRKESFHI
jgi:hypothetical protein